ncbi:MAG: ATP-binding protein [Thermodesulfovibrionales bacterium]|nr:ATP-binding protein [Thermodesulfovibrionales bacterium]
MPDKLSINELYKCCDMNIFKFNTTDDLPPFEGTIGQDRALKALDFGISLENSGFNIFILGENGTGKMSTIKSILSKQSLNEPVSSDWCYVYNFKDADAPIAVSLEPGRAVTFQKDMDELIKILRVEVPKVFESKEYDKQKNLILEEFQKKQKDLFSTLEDEAQAKGFSIRKTVSGLLIVPVKKTGEPLNEEEFDALDEKTKKKVEELGKTLQEKLDDVVRTLREGEKLVKDLLGRLEREAALSAVGHLIDELKSKYRDHEKITAYLEDAKEDILAHLDDFKTTEEQAPALPFMKAQKAEPTFTRYTVNVLVNNKESKGAPCVFESNPTYFNLFGRIEHKIQYGIAITDFSMIKAGSLHRANGGYLVINVLDLLRNLFAYDALKRSIRNKDIRIDDVWEQYRLVSTTTLKPEAIPLDVKVILVGDPRLYYMLYNLDEEYRELFKVKSDFDSRMDRTDENMHKYASFVAAKCKDDKLLPFDRSGIAKVIEYGSRLAEHQEKLSSKFSEVTDLINEAHYWALKAKSKVVMNEHVEKAIDERVYRNNRIEERLREMIAEGTLIVETSGARVGQINGLAVLDLGDYSFGKPSRITAKTWTGKAGVLNIEREIKMSGKIHEKAMLILTNYLGSTYATKKPISISASITFEQLYDMVEGDSATCAELYALLSSIANVPIKQHIAITGSMDQNGDVQPIGGVNEKIEGFFELCRLRGLDGSHGVVIPRRNIKHLMIKKAVVDAVREGKFSIYPISRVEEGIEILTGMPAGALQEDGTYPEGTINYLIVKRLTEISDALKEKKDKEEEKNEKDKDK